MAIRDFLKERGVEEDIINMMEDEKIEEDTVLLMEDHLLQLYLPKLGDRIALRNYCQRVLNGSTNPMKRKSLMEIVNEETRVKRKTSSVGDDNEEKDENGKAGPSGKKNNAEKPTRTVQFGWINGCGAEFKQVRSNKGGGNRKISVLKSWKKHDLIEIGKSLFFPEGISPLGEVKDFTYDLTDFKGCTWENEDLTVEDILKQTTMQCLRFYLKTDRAPEPATAYSEMSCLNTDHKEIDVRINRPLTCEPCGLHSGDQIVVCHHLEINRAMLMEQLVTILTDEKYRAHDEYKIIVTNQDGVSKEDNIRECISEFWQEFYASCSTGTSFKIPYLRHDFGSLEWMGVGKIISIGYRLQNYFPIKIAPIFMEQCLFSNIYSDILENYFLFLSESETAMLKGFIDFRDDYTKHENYGELLDFLAGHQCRKVVNHDNICNILKEIAHKEMIQEPKFIADCIQAGMDSCVAICNEELSDIYDNLTPSADSVISSLKVSNESLQTTQEGTFVYLKRFIRECDETELHRFLRFCTGSDLMSTNEIHICFNDISGLSRNPVPNTCDFILEIPTNYHSYSELKTEFLIILQNEACRSLNVT